MPLPGWVVVEVFGHAAPRSHFTLSPPTLRPRPTAPPLVQLDLAALYPNAEPGAHVYRLRSLVCCSGAHHQAFVLVPELKRWLLFDDTRVANIGTWADVRRKVRRGKGGLGPSCHILCCLILRCWHKLHTQAFGLLWPHPPPLMASLLRFPAARLQCELGRVQPILLLMEKKAD